ncbi:MAG: anthranilate phosphoribosyltransferase [Planctomycetes bacterium]|nr:anthranilate phosphoribosyltransferase [Planctomycetota bacterium]
MATSWSDLLSRLASGQAVEADAVAWAMEQILQGKFTENDVSAFLLGLRARGDNADHLSSAARILREHMIRWDPGSGDVLDTCGTGGDQSGAFNISTATAFVLAGAGVRVVKHGNRAVSSNSGSADVLAALGISLVDDPIQARANLDRCKLAFCFAPHFHPALKQIAPIRKKLGVPTLFNSVGPLVNPAGAQRQLLGVGRFELLDVMAEALVRLGSVRTLVVHGEDGLDEVTLGGATWVREVRAGAVMSHVWRPSDFGLEPVARAGMLAADAAASAALIRQILAGADVPAARVVLANAAAGLLIADKVQNLPAGVAMARAAIESGAAKQVLNYLDSR